MSSAAPAASVHPQIGRLTLHEIWTSLKYGVADFRRAPLYGVFFASVYVIAGNLLLYLGAGSLIWSLALVLGFPIVAPFAAVGLYEVSRRLEAEEPLVFASVLGVVLAERRRQLPWIGAILVITFLFWSFLAHMVFALFMGLRVMTNVSSSYEVFLTPNGLTMIGVEILIGGVVALLVFAGTVVSLPFAVDREVDFVTAIVTSFRAFGRNTTVLLVWGALIAFMVIVAVLPGLLGLLIVLPVVGHASWHIYRRVLFIPG